MEQVKYDDYLASHAINSINSLNPINLTNNYNSKSDYNLKSKAFVAPGNSVQSNHSSGQVTINRVGKKGGKSSSVIFLGDCEMPITNNARIKLGDYSSGGNKSGSSSNSERADRGQKIMVPSGGSPNQRELKNYAAPNPAR